jgi:hypothetical protein
MMITTDDNYSCRSAPYFGIPGTPLRIASNSKELYYGGFAVRVNRNYF